jgi:hypothetical protein
VKRVLPLAALLSLILARAAIADTPLRVEATLGRDRHGDPTLQFQLTNVSDSPITMDEDELPWEWRYSLKIVSIVRRKERDPLPGISPISDLVEVTKSVTIAPGQTLRGSLRNHLSNYIGNFDEERKRNDLVVFWFYDAEDTNDASLGAYGGWVLVPRAN